MTEKHSEELACKMEPSDPENTVGSEEINLAKSRFNILDLLENSSKQSHGSPSASSDGHESETPAVPMFDPRVALPQLAALFHHGILPGVVPITPALAHPGLPFLPWVPVQAIPKVDSSPNSQSETNSKQGGDMSHSGVRDENKDLRNSMGGSPLDSDVEEDDEENGDGRGSDDDGHQDVNGSNRKKKTRTVFSRHQVSQLEMTFDMKRYLSSGERAHLAQKLHLSETQVKIWFQNRRNKFKRQSNTGEESTLQTHRANMFAGLSSDRLPQLPAHLLPAVSSPMTLRPIALPAPLDPSAAARLLFSYGALAAQVHNIM